MIAHWDTQYEVAAFAPRVDIAEDTGEFVILVDLPGVDRDSVEINVEQNTLFLRGERKPDTRLPAESIRREERQHGRFARSFTLPRTIDTTSIDATLENGVLRVRLPKAASSVLRKIEVH